MERRYRSGKARRVWVILLPSETRGSKRNARDVRRLMRRSYLSLRAQTRPLPNLSRPPLVPQVALTARFGHLLHINFDLRAARAAPAVHEGAARYIERWFTVEG